MRSGKKQANDETGDAVVRPAVAEFATRQNFAYLTAGAFPVLGSVGAAIEYGIGTGVMVMGGCCLVLAWMLGAD